MEILLLAILMYQGGTKSILKNFSHLIKGNNKTGLVGKVGSGKTILLKLIAGLENYSGNIFVDGQNIKKYNYDSIMNHIAYILQHPKMFNKTIYHNLSYGTNKTQSQILKFIKDIGFEQFFKKFPKQLHSQVGKEGKNLSEGQKQIIVIIRELLKDKKIVLLDEPTSALDSETKNLVIKLLSDIKTRLCL
jgi:ABC-type bacteriocin/lantibiotic exporter with double-glycine peptidase domain